mmetsp:Transcript_26311/g.62468  ORF Transcript_26311/g.62468 Transcript_26311/m.62468 type:complete len:244 (+) Transcript_26311:611-1342(+)
MALDRRGLLGLGAAALHHVRVDGALREEGRALVAGVACLELGGLGLEHVDEQAADDLALLLGVGHAGEFTEEELAGVDADDLGVQLAGEHLHHHVAFVQPQQAMVDEHAGELVANGTVDQCGGDAGVHAARQAEDDLFVTDLLADARHGLVDVAAHLPVAPAAGDVTDEARQHGRALQRVRDLGVELHGIEATHLIGHAGDRAARRRRHQAETRRQGRDLVAMAHPDLEHAAAVGRAEILNAL